MLSINYSTLSKYKIRLLILIVTVCIIAVVYYDSNNDDDDEETILYKDNQLLSFFPSKIHDKVLEIYNRIPGTFRKYLDVRSTAKKFECSKHDFTIQIYIGSCHSLHGYIRQSLRQKFRDNQVTELNPDKLARKIVANCRQKYENWGKDDTSSAIFQFNTRDIFKNNQETTYVQGHIYTDLSLECQKSIISFFVPFFPRTCHTDYDLTIELTKMSMNSSKISQLQQIISNNNVEESIKLLEKDITLSWDDLDDPKSSWDDL